MTTLGAIPLKSDPISNEAPITNTSLKTTSKLSSNTSSSNVSSKPPIVKPKKKPSESMIALKIRKMQEEKRLLEEAEKQREQLQKQLEEEALLKEKLRKKEATKQKLIHTERNKKIQQEHKKRDAFDKSIAKYGYNPTIKPRKPNINVKNNIKNNKDDVVINDVKNNFIEDGVIEDGVIEDWDTSLEEIENIPKDIKENIKENVGEIIDVKNNIKSPIVCILGAVDSGKTHLLDYIRSSTMYHSEAGNITQQITASYIDLTKLHNNFIIPGLIFIDTPGHQPFVSMRTRASKLCNVVILMVDLLSGIQKQTLECIDIILKQNKSFVVALNKVDLLYNYDKNKPLEEQDTNIMIEFRDRVRQITVQFQELGINVKLYNDMIMGEDYSNMVPISAITGEGIDDLLLTVAQTKQPLMNNNGNIECTVLEVTNMVGRGTTMDVILNHGRLCKGIRLYCVV